VRQGELCEHDRRDDVGLVHAGALLLDLGQRRRVAVARVVDQHVDAAAVLEGRVYDSASSGSTVKVLVRITGPPLLHLLKERLLPVHLD
jgi:hypothetical protein